MQRTLKKYKFWGSTFSDIYPLTKHSNVSNGIEYIWLDWPIDTNVSVTEQVLIISDMTRHSHLVKLYSWDLFFVNKNPEEVSPNHEYLNKEAKIYVHYRLFMPDVSRHQRVILWCPPTCLQGGIVKRVVWAFNLNSFKPVISLEGQFD